MPNLIHPFPRHCLHCHHSNHSHPSYQAIGTLNKRHPLSQSIRDQYKQWYTILLPSFFSPFPFPYPISISILPIPIPHLRIPYCHRDIVSCVLPHTYPSSAIATGTLSHASRNSWEALMFGNAYQKSAAFDKVSVVYPVPPCYYFNRPQTK